MTSFAEWLRSNSEHYLMEASQRDMARKYGLPVREERTFRTMFWRLAYVPIYRGVPWSIRKLLMILMPGSHRRRWEDRAPPYH
jgi:hypothetical protein